MMNSSAITTHETQFLFYIFIKVIVFILFLICSSLPLNGYIVTQLNSNSNYLTLYTIIKCIHAQKYQEFCNLIN